MANKAAAKIARMIQPESLKSAEYQPWSLGRGTDVWAMLYASIAGDLETIKKLVASDAGLVSCEYEYLTPLRFAVRENHEDIVHFLLQKSGKTPSFGDSLVTIARDRGYKKLQHLLEAKLKEEYHIIPEGETIAKAIRAFDLPQVYALLEEQPSLLHAADARGNQPIHWAVLTRQVKLIDYLLERGADINAMRPDGARPIDLTNGDYHYRSWYRDLPPDGLKKHEFLVGYLVAKGAYYNISVASKMGDVDRVRTLLDEDPALVNKLPDHVGYYSGLPLRTAAAAGHIEVVRLLLQRGANPNEPEPGIAPMGGALHSAIGGKHLAIVKLLLEHGANPNADVESSGNCFSMAMHIGASKEMLNLIASYGGCLTVELMCYYGDITTLATLLRMNPQTDLSSGLGSLIGEGQQQCMELVLRHQPDVLKGFMVRHIHSPAYARWLMERGLDPRQTDWLGATLLHHSAARGDIGVAEVCIDFGADINAIDTDYSSTPLGWAARDGRREMVEWLLEKNANPNLPEDESWALPVEWAKRRGHNDIAEILQRAINKTV